jgi:predicted DNA-binding transcriptional regulator AlpA
VNQDIPALKPVIRINDLIKAGYGTRSTILEHIRQGAFPKPYRIGGRPGWYANEIEDFFRAREAS